MEAQMRIMDNELRPEILPIPTFMRHLKVHRGYPVPWFVDWIDGQPEFRAMDRRKFVRAINERLCWVCGNELFGELIFTVGPMCGINKISSEPPSHRECARFSARACPFLSKPKMERREFEHKDKKTPTGIMVERNPGVTLLWFTRRFTTIQARENKAAGVGAGVLFKLGRAFKVEWYREGRPATRAEIMESIDTGLPLLHDANRKQAGDDAEALANLTAAVEAQLAEAMRLVPMQ